MPDAKTHTPKLACDRLVLPGGWAFCVNAAGRTVHLYFDAASVAIERVIRYEA
jgi:hypothetical protein